jgi:hypothetical protein
VPVSTPASFIGQHGTQGVGELKRLTGVFFGPPKSGKTSAAASGQRTLLIEFDPDGDQTNTLAGRSDLVVVKPQNWTDVEAITKDLAGIERDNFDTVTCDSITFWVMMLGGRQLAKAAQENSDPRREYQKIGSNINQAIRDMLTLPHNVIFTAHLKVEGTEDDDGVALNPEEGEYPVTLAVTPMVFGVLNASVSFIGRTFKRPGKAGSEYFVSFDDGGRSPAGTRVPLPKTVKNPNMDTLLAYAKKGNKE